MESTKAMAEWEKKKQMWIERDFTRHAREINTFYQGIPPFAFYKTSAPEGYLPIICRSTTANKSQTSFSCCLTHGQRRKRCFTVKPQACKRSLCLPWGVRWNNAVYFLYGLGNRQIFTVWPSCAHMWREAFRGDNLWRLSRGQLGTRCDGSQSMFILFLKRRCYW